MVTIIKKTYKEKGKDITWEIFEEELWAQFEPTKRVDFDEALSRVKQVASL